MIGQKLLNLPDHLECMWGPADEDFEVNTSQLTKRMKHQASVLNHFWKRWRYEYRNELRESHRYSVRKTEHHPHVSEGDIVIVHDEILPHGLWKLGQIQELLTGCDGLPREGTSESCFKRLTAYSVEKPLQLLYPQEICEAETLRASPVCPQLTMSGQQGEYVRN